MFWNFFIAFLYLWYKISVTAYLFHIYIYSIILLQIKLISSLTYLQTHRQGCCVSVGWSRSKWARAWTAPSSSPCMLEQHIIGPLLVVHTSTTLAQMCWSLQARAYCPVSTALQRIQPVPPLQFILSSHLWSSVSMMLQLSDWPTLLL